MTSLETRSTDLLRDRRVYQNHHLDSTRWERYAPRAGDVIVTTAYKAGTTFTQEILLHLLHGLEDPLPERGEISPWIDARFHPGTLDDLYAALEKQQGIRFMKSHLPHDGLPYFEQVRYLVVARDPRDVFMSLSNHHENYTDLAYESVDGGDRLGDPMPRFDKDLQCVSGTGSREAGSSGSPRAGRSGGTCATPRVGGTSGTCRTSASCTTPTCSRISSEPCGRSPRSSATR